MRNGAGEDALALADSFPPLGWCTWLITAAFQGAALRAAAATAHAAARH